LLGVYDIRPKANFSPATGLKLVRDAFYVFYLFYSFPGTRGDSLRPHSLTQDYRVYLLTSAINQAIPLALNFIASGECLRAQRMLLYVEER
jgi:hypothetical protein